MVAVVFLNSDNGVTCKMACDFELFLIYETVPVIMIRPASRYERITLSLGIDPESADFSGLRILVIFR